MKSSSPPLRFSPFELLARLPGPVTARWPQGERFAVAFERGDLTLELYAPRGTDPQQPHDRDELYIITAGSGRFICGSTETAFAAGDVLFVPAGAAHRFVDFSDDFSTWVIFFGPRTTT
jgi:Cupin domain